ncbi:MAG: 4'-phosphopantetheinyl transferase superfamily protein [Flavobacteriales bacterium]
MSAEIYKIQIEEPSIQIAFQGKQCVDFYEPQKLFPIEMLAFENIRQEGRQVEFLGIRNLRDFLALQSPIHYQESGKPYIGNDAHSFISISHSKNYCALSVGVVEMGIDIEEISERIERISERFVHPEEMEFIEQDRLTGLTRLWTMKEAMFKLNARTGIEFKTELRIESTEGSRFIGRMLTSSGWKNVVVECFQHEQLILSICRYQ